MRDLPQAPPAPPEPTARGLWRRIPWWSYVLAAVALTTGAWGVYQLTLVQAVYADVERQFIDLEERVAAIPPLSEAEIDSLRRSLNPEHIAAAESLGINPVLRRNRLEQVSREAGLVRIQPTPRYRLLDADHSIYVATHGVRRSLDSLSARFWDRLAARDLPGFRYTVSSMLRSREDQATLRGVNVNAAGGTSSHEHGTTFDVTYRRFGYAGGPEPELGKLPRAIAPFVRTQVRQRLRILREGEYRRLAREYAEPLAAELGRALIDLEDEGVLLALREQRQPVYHVTALLGDGTVAQGRP